MNADDFAAVTSVGAAGERLVACAYGGQLLSWFPAGSSDDRLWLSPLARFEPGVAVRGGVPVIFPQFADRGPLPKHGFARDRPWAMRPGLPGTDGTDGTAARILARLHDDEATRQIWPHRFTLTLEMVARGAALELRLEVSNDDSAEFTFTAALHSYFRLNSRTDQPWISGAGAAMAQDNAARGRPVRLQAGELPALGPFDLAIPGLLAQATPVAIHDPGDGVVQVAAPDTRADSPPDAEPDARGFTDVVLWNPGDQHGLADVPVDGARSFVCVEPSRLTPCRLAPGALWVGTARFVLIQSDVGV